jgi:hypothetical protein
VRSLELSFLLVVSQPALSKAEASKDTAQGKREKVALKERKLVAGQVKLFH